MLEKDGTFIRPAEVSEPYARVFFQQMQAFTFGFMQDIVSFFHVLEDKKIPIEYALGSIKLRQEVTDMKWSNDNRDRQLWNDKAKRCPKCGAVLMFMPIDEPEGPKNRKGYKGRWYCVSGWAEDDPTKICGYEAFTTKHINYYFKKYGIRRRIKER